MVKNSDICVVISLYNEEGMIADCIDSALRLTDEVIVVDTESTDRTAQIAKDLGVEVFSFPRAPIIEPSRNFAMSKATKKWVYILDADERFSDELIVEIGEVIKSDKYTWYRGPRLNIFAQKWPLRNGGWWPDMVIRMIKKEAFKNWPAEIHSTAIVDGPRGELTAPLLHNSQGDLNIMVEKTVRFEEKEATLLNKAGRKSGTLIFFRKFLAEFYRRAIKNKGLLDGPAGLIASLYQAFSKTITYLILYEKNLS